MNTVKVMSFNLRTATPEDGINCMENRAPRVQEVLRREAPDLIGFQEAYDWVWSWLDETLAGDYQVIGCGRNADCSGEGVPVAFRKSRFQMLGADCFWLSDTPHIPGSRYEHSDQSKCPRMAVSLLLRDRESGAMITFVNTHTDHVGATVRKLELRQVSEYLAERPGYKIVTGDMNAKPDSEEIACFSECVKPMNITDCTSLVGGTFHGYGHENPYWKIDYIFSDLPAAKSCAVPDTPVNGVYYSDHLAVCSVLQLNDKSN